MSDLLQFGALVPCRTCRGTGESRNPEWGDKNAAKERARQRRHGHDVPKPTELVPCVECGGAGYLAPDRADVRRIDRAELRTSKTP